MQKQKVEMLFRQYYKRMYAKAFGLLYDEQESKDVVSDIFVSLLESKIELLPSAEGQYLLSAMHNRCLKRLRDKSNRERIAKLYADSLQDEEDEERRLQELVDFANRELSEQELTIFTMRFIDGREYKEICDVVGISRFAVWKHLKHIMNLLKQYYNNPDQL